MRTTPTLLAAAILLLACVAGLASGAGCHKLFDWNAVESKCEERYVCSIGSSCDGKQRLCQENTFCNADGVCETTRTDGSPCLSDSQCTSRTCSLRNITGTNPPVVQGTCVVHDTMCDYPRGCGPNYYCDRTQSKCVTRIGVGQECDASLPNPSDVCEGGLTCAPATERGGVCVPLLSLQEGSNCSPNATAQCMYGLTCMGGVCTATDGLSCTSGGDSVCGVWPQSYCSCQENVGAGVQTCTSLYNMDCAGKFQDLVECMANKKCSFDPLGYETNSSCIARSCYLEYFMAQCCKYSKFDWLYGQVSPQLMPLGVDCATGSPAGYLLVIILLVIAVGFLGVVVIAYRQFLSRASMYSRLSSVDEDEEMHDDDDIQLRQHTSRQSSSASSLPPSSHTTKFDPLNGAW